VPFFNKRLPPSEFPRLAYALVKLEFFAGDEIVRQGEEGKAFYVIRTGTASVSVDEDEEEDEPMAVLSPGDFIGGHCLTEKRANVATVTADSYVVAYCLTRDDFKKSGLEKALIIPKRRKLVVDQEDEEPASPRTSPSGSVRDSGMGSPSGLYPKRLRGSQMSTSSFGDSLNSQSQIMSGSSLTDEEAAVVGRALTGNANLRALTDASPEVLKRLGARAEKRYFAEGEVAAEAYEHGDEFFIIGEGSFNVFAPPRRKETANTSAEAAVARGEMYKQMERKQQFLSSFLKSNGKKQKRSMSRSFEEETAAGGAQNLDRMAISMPMGGMATLRPGAGKPMGNLVAKGLRTSRTAHFSELTAGPAAGHTFSEMSRQVSAGRNPDEPTLISTIGPGESFGELSLLYNTRRVATWIAAEDSMVYVISRRHFRKVFSREGPFFKDACRLFEEVAMLSTLLRAERDELARNVSSRQRFKPFERVLTQGAIRQAAKWYVIDKGSCKIWRAEEEPQENGVKKPQVVRQKELAVLTRSGHFGERSILRDEPASDFNVDAGPEGMTCFIVDGEILKQLRTSHIGEEDFDLPLHCEGSDYYAHQEMRAANNLHAEEEVKVLEDLDILAVLGSGGFGSVYLAQNPETKEQYALKRMSKGHIEKTGAKKQVVSERDILSTCTGCPFIICLVRTFKDDQHVYFLLEKASGGDLQALVSNHYDVLADDKPRGSAAAFYVASIMHALDYMHERRIVYRDLKLENVLLNEDGLVKLCDMGFARFVLSKTSTLLGTPAYMAPEMIDFPHMHNRMVDWWALGCLAFELLAGQGPWDSAIYGGDMEDDGDVYGMLVAYRKLHDQGMPDTIPGDLAAAKDFILKCLKVKPEKRMGAGGLQEAKAHTWFQSINFDFDALSQCTMPVPFKAGTHTAPGLPRKPSEAFEQDGGFGALYTKFEEATCGWDSVF